MLIAISGSQGCGKSTILQSLRELGFNTVSRKTSRSILADWNVTLEEVNSNMELTLEFQDEIIKRKWQDEHQAMVSSDLWFTERTFADLFTYAVVTLGHHNANGKWLEQYYQKCIKYCQGYSQVFYLKAGHFDIQHDGVRGSNMHYSRLIDVAMLDFTKQMIRPRRLNVIDTPNLQQRIDIITAHSVERLEEE